MTVRVYRALIRLLLPSTFVDAFGGELTAVFADVDRRARADHGRLAAWRGLAAELPGLVRLALAERRSHRTVRAPAASARLEENVFDALHQDVAFGARALRRSPVFAIVGVLTLALGIGANTAIFTVVNGVLLSPLKLADPDRLVAVGEQPLSAAASAIGVTSPGGFYDWKRQTRTMQLGAYDGGILRTLTGFGEPQLLTGSNVVGGLMDVLGVPAFLGRELTSSDEDPSSPAVVVLSYDAWHRLFGDDRGAIGKVLVLSGTPRRVVGVMPPGFTFPGAPNDFWAPAQFDPAFRANRDQYMLSVVGRLGPHATIEQARADMRVIMARLVHDWPLYDQGRRSTIVPLRESIVGGVRDQLVVLMGAVAFVLLIACANIGNLLLARASSRRREIAVRQALGASTWRIARQLLTESVLLAVAGGLAGVFVGRVFLELLMSAPVMTTVPRVEEIALDGRVLAFTLAVSIAAGLLFGVVPAWQTVRVGAAEALREGARSSSRQLARSVLVVSELTLALMLLIGAGLLLRSFSQIQRVRPGVNPDHVLTFSVSPPRGDRIFFPTALERIRALPGVRSAALTSMVPVSGRGIGAWFTRLDRPAPLGAARTGDPYRVVTPDYFATVGIPLVRGRYLTDADRLEAPAIVINEALAMKYYRGEDPIGKPVYLGAPDNRLFESAPIVGIVGDTHDVGLGSDPLPTVYIAARVMPTWIFFSFVIRTSGDPMAVMAAARQVVHDVDSAVPIRSVQLLDDVVSQSLAPARWSAALVSVFAGLALLIAVLGVFGVLSFIVALRTREVGIRVALGASPAAVRALIVRRGLGLLVVGLALGVPGALVLTRFMSSLLYGVTPADPMTFAGVSAVLTVCVVAASYVPARRATRVDPIEALRVE